MTYKFENLEVWKLAMMFNSKVYEIADELPECEKFNLHSQMKRASTSIALNIAEGSTGQSNAEQARFLSYAIRSYVKVYACYRLIQDRGYLMNSELRLNEFEDLGAKLFSKLQAFYKTLK